MRIGLTSKLFLAILLSNVAIAVVVAVAAQVALKSGFRSYVNEREERRLATLADSLVEAYREHGNWQFLQANETRWREFNRPGPPGRRDASGERRPPPPGGREPERRPPPPREGGRGPPRPPPPSATLFDGDRRWVVGRQIAIGDAMLRPVVVDAVTVGWVASAFRDEPFDRADVRFQEEQLRASWIIGGIAVLLAALVSVVLARRMLAPVRRLAGATHRLASGDYSARVRSDARDELGQLVRDFNQLAVTLEKNEALRRRFMAEISHELRTPLAVLKGELEALEDGIRTPDAQSLASLQFEVAALSKLIDDLYDLSLADIGALTYRLEPVDLAAILDNAAHAFRERFSARGIALEWTPPAQPLPVDGDAARLGQLFNNLLENSLRYTNEGGRLRLDARQDGDRVIIDFQDSPPGVPDALLPRLFERLFRVESSRSRAQGGAGLGLSLCRSIVEAHGGTIDAKPSPLGGLWIEVVLRYARS